MAIIRNGKVYRNIQEQVLKNTEDIDELNHRLPIEGKFYTEEETDELLDLKADKSNTYTQEETNELLASKADKPTWHMFTSSGFRIYGESGNTRHWEITLLSTYSTIDELKQHIGEIFENYVDDDYRLNADKFQIVSVNYEATVEDDQQLEILRNIISFSYDEDTDYFYITMNKYNTHDESISPVTINTRFIQIF